jgi:hypothetical protein
VRIGAYSALGAQVVGHHLDRVVRRMGDLAGAGIWLVGGIAVVLVVGALAAVEVGVDVAARAKPLNS